MRLLLIVALVLLVPAGLVLLISWLARRPPAAPVSPELAAVLRRLRGTWRGRSTEVGFAVEITIEPRGRGWRERVRCGESERVRDCNVLAVDDDRVRFVQVDTLEIGVVRLEPDRLVIEPRHAHETEIALTRA
jgi:hypothetical protein